jgi:hypothetical protein
VNRRKPWVAVIALGGFALLAIACGPVEYLNQVSVRAATALADAEQRGGDRWAPYEMTAARAYLHEAREQVGHSGYQRAIDCGRRAEELAIRAGAIARERGKPDGGAPSSR